MSFLLAGCGAEGMEDIDSVSQELAPGEYFYMSNSGRLHSSAATPDWNAVTSVDIYNAAYDNATFRGNHPHRFAIVDQADLENDAGRCGSAARSRYGYESGDKWCTEYARWLFRVPGQAPNVRFCFVHVIGCLDYVYLSEADTVSDMVSLFQENGGWISEANIKTTSPVPGDYLALTGGSGEKKSHSAVVMAVSSDYKFVWTSEGNVGDCVRFRKRPFFTNGKLNPDINGLGKLQAFY